MINNIPNFLPMTLDELSTLGWDSLDVILVSGDAYIDSPFNGIALIGKMLLAHGYKVGVVAQPQLDSPDDILLLGVPRVCWGVTAGMTDSIVANYTAIGKRRKSCDFTPGGENNRRPDRATIKYTNLIKQYDKSKKPIVLGGIEASLRRFAHYDQLSDTVRRSILIDSKADYIVYGMGEYTLLNLVKAIDNNSDISKLDGIVYAASTIPDNATLLPSYEDTAADSGTFMAFFKEFYHNSSTESATPLAQKHANRFVIQTPPAKITSAQLDYIHDELHFERSAHPIYKKLGKVKAEDITKTSIVSHRGCFGECSFCAIAVHQGRSVVSRSETSILSEIQKISKSPKFNGIISDIGGPTANMYGTECINMKNGSPCANKKCLYPDVCKSLANSQDRYTKLLEKARKLPNIKKVLISSGIRCDLTMADSVNGEKFIDSLAQYHTGGQIKLAPEHSDSTVLALMGKSAIDSFELFCKKYKSYSDRYNKQQYITYYFMSGHPGCRMTEMENLAEYIRKNIYFTPEQVQIFTPTPSTISTAMYHCMKDMDGKHVYVAKTANEKQRQKDRIALRNNRYK